MISRPQSNGHLKPRRIALVVGTLALGGTETQLCRLAEELQQRGHIVMIFALFKGGPLERRLQMRGIPYDIVRWQGFVYRDPDRGLIIRELAESMIVVWAFWKRLRRFSPDVCHAFLSWAYMIAMPGAAIARVPARVSARRSLSSELNLRPRDRLLEILSVVASDVIVANSQVVADDARRAERIPARRLHVIPNGVDLPAEPSDVTREPAIGLMVANLIRYKGHDDLISAMRLLNDPPVIRLVGDGPERGRLEERVKQGGLADKLLFEGSVFDAKRLFAGVQFAVLASHQEGMPNAVLEAMACGVPVVATAVGGVVELIEPEVNGILIPSRDHLALARAVERLAGDPMLRRRLGTAARAKACTLSWGRCIDAHERLYAEVLDRNLDRRGRRRTLRAR